MDLLFDKTFDYRIRNHHCIGYTDYVVEIIYGLHPTNELVFNDCINDKTFFLKSILVVRSFWSIRMIGVYMTYLFLTCVCI